MVQQGLLVWAIIRYRRSEHPTAAHARCELIWLLVPAARYWHFIDAVWVMLIARFSRRSAVGAGPVMVAAVATGAAAATRADGLSRERLPAVALAGGPLALVAVLLLALAPDLAAVR